MTEEKILLLPGLDFYCFLKNNGELVGSMVKLNGKLYIYEGFNENEIRIPFKTKEDLFEYIKLKKYEIYYGI